MPVRPEGKGSGLKQQFVVEEEDKAIRIDKYLSERCPELSRSYLQKLLKEQGVTVNGKAVKANYKIQAGDLVQTTLPDLTEPDILPENKKNSYFYRYFIR